MRAVFCPLFRMSIVAATLLGSQGIAADEPDRRLVVARSLRTSLLLVFRDAVSPERIEMVRRFCNDRSFDLVYHADIVPGEINRFNRVENAPYHKICMGILRRPKETFRAHVFRIHPSSDDAPYFSHFFKWTALPQLITTTGRNVAVHVGWGYMFLLITLVQAIPLGALLILLPLGCSARGQSGGYPHRLRAYAYFAAMGFGFMFLEMAAIQQFARFLLHPVHAFGITLGIVLLFSGMGNQRICVGDRSPRGWPGIGIVGTFGCRYHGDGRIRGRGLHLSATGSRNAPREATSKLGPYGENCNVAAPLCGGPLTVSCVPRAVPDVLAGKLGPYVAAV